MCVGGGGGAMHEGICPKNWAFPRTNIQILISNRTLQQMLTCDTHACAPTLMCTYEICKVYILKQEVDIELFNRNESKHMVCFNKVC